MTTTKTPVVIPSVHVRAALTWVAIFPLVALGMVLITPVSGDWHPVLRAFVMTLFIVPIAVYVVMPRLMALYVRAATRRRA